MIKFSVPGLGAIRDRIAAERANLKKNTQKQLQDWANEEVADFRMWIYTNHIQPPKKVPNGMATGVQDGILVPSIIVVSVGDSVYVTYAEGDHPNSGTSIADVGIMLEEGAPDNNQPARPHIILLKHHLAQSAPGQIKRIANAILARIAGR